MGSLEAPHKRGALLKPSQSRGLALPQPEVTKMAAAPQLREGWRGRRARSWDIPSPPRGRGITRPGEKEVLPGTPGTAPSLHPSVDLPTPLGRRRTPPAATPLPPSQSEQQARNHRFYEWAARPPTCRPAFSKRRVKFRDR